MTLPAFSARAAATLPRALAGRWLTQTATVYSESAGGAFDHVDTADLACLLVPLNTASAPDGGARAELLARRILYWDPAYALPERAQVEIDGERWILLMGTLIHDVLPQVDVVRAGQ